MPKTLHTLQDPRSKNPAPSGKPIPVPLIWRRAITENITEAARVQLSWRTNNGPNTSWIALGDEHAVRVVEITDPNTRQTVYAVETDTGHCSPGEFADELWLECYEVYLAEREKRGGELERVYAQIEVFNDEGAELASVSKGCCTDPNATADEPGQVWITDTESEEDRRDRSMSREHRKEREQMQRLLHNAWETATRAIGLMAESHSETMLEREKLLREERERIEDLREGSMDDRRAELLIEKLGEFAKYAMHTKAPPPGSAPGSDPLIDACRDLGAHVDADAWDRLLSIDPIFADLRTVLERSARFDATRPEILAASQAIFMEVARINAEAPERMAQAGPIFGAENMGRINRIREMLTP